MNAKSLQIETPPWAHDSAHWLPLPVVARQHFQRDPVTVKRWIKSGFLKERGYDSYWDGKRWFVRLPSSVTTERISQIRQNERNRA